MTIQAIHSKAAIKGHPIHAMLVGFPIALYTAGLVSLIVYSAVRDPFWFRAAMTMWFAGVGMAALAAIFGAVDLFAGVPREETATRRTGLKHMAFNVLALVLFTAGAFMLLDTWQRAFDVATMDTVFPITIGAVGLLLTAAAGFQGWKLVQTHHVGVEDASEPTSTVAPRSTGPTPSVLAPTLPRTNPAETTHTHN
jgi:uncharacterized membrane protein